MNKSSAGIFLMAAALAASPVAKATGEGWTDNFEQAKKQAAEEDKDILIDFTGSDWCGWCIKLDNEVFKQDAFKASAPKDFVLVVLDYPRDKTRVSEETAKQNETLKTEFAIRGFPTLYLTDAAGRPYAKASYQAGGPESYLKYLAGLKATGAARSQAFAAAKAEKDELAKARQLDTALEAMDPELVSQFYTAEIKQIMALDAANKAGLKSKYEQLKFGKELTALLEQGKFEDAGNAVKEILASWALSEEDAADLSIRYGRMIFDVRMQHLLRDGKCDDAADLLAENLADWKLPEAESATLKKEYEFKIFEVRYWSMIYQKQFDDAAACVEAWIEAEKPEGQALIKLRLMVGRIHGMKGDVEAALAVSDAVIKEFNPSGEVLQEALLVKFNAYRIKGDEESQYKIVEQVIAAEPNNDRSKYFRKELEKRKAETQE